MFTLVWRTMSKVYWFIYFIFFSEPGAPSGLTVTAYTDTTISLSWTAPTDGLVSDYEVTHTDSSTSTATAVLVGSDAVTLQLSGLNPGENYTITVKAVSNGEESTDSAPVTQVTSKYLSLPIL